MLRKWEHPDLHFTFPVIKPEKSGSDHKTVSDDYIKEWHKRLTDSPYFSIGQWLDDINALYSSRQYAFYRPKDQSILFVGNTKWACIEIATGRPKRMSPSFTHAYQPIPADLNPMDFSISYAAME